MRRKKKSKINNPTDPALMINTPIAKCEKDEASDPSSTSQELRQQWLMAIAAAIIGALVSAIVSVPASTWISDRQLRQKEEALSANQQPMVDLMKREAELALAWPHTPELEAKYGELFSNDAVIFDKGNSKDYSLQPRIRERYMALEKFESLDHLIEGGPSINADGSAMAYTNTIFKLRGKTFRDYDLWLFKKDDKGKWKINSFTYNIQK